MLCSTEWLSRWRERVCIATRRDEKAKIVSYWLHLLHFSAAAFLHILYVRSSLETIQRAKRWYRLEIPVNPTGLACRDPEKQTMQERRGKTLWDFFLFLTWTSAVRCSWSRQHCSSSAYSLRGLRKRLKNIIDETLRFFHNSRLCIELPVHAIFIFFDQIRERSREREAGTWRELTKSKLRFDTMRFAALLSLFSSWFFVTHIHSSTRLTMEQQQQQLSS